MPKIYLDACCLNRPFDDQAQDRIRLESEAVLLTLKRVESSEWQWIASEPLGLEIEQTPDPERKRRVSLLTSYAHYSVLVQEKESDRAQHLESLGFKAFDALHIACAESAGADVLLTTDDQLLKQAAREPEQLHVRVENPLTWLKEMTKE